MTINDGGAVSHQAYAYQHDQPVQTLRKRHIQEPIAVVGMGCRLPGDSNSPHALWEFLERGGTARNEAPESRFDLKTHHDGSKKPKTMRSPGGMFLEKIDPRDFDAQFFEIPRMDATAMDPQQRQLLEVVYESLENAGITLQALSGSPVGCFVGSYAVDYADMQARDPEDRAPSVTIGVGRAILSNRISHFLNIKGPSMTIDTACSGSLVAIDVACRYLQTGEISGAIVAASNLYLSPEHNMDVGPMKGASSLSGLCHTFDVKADGYIKGEAVNAVILKRLDDAIRDGDPIRAVIRGTATNSDGHTPGIASPSSEAQATAIRAAYANAGITDFNETTYLECHGTGTQAGDPTEVKGISSVFAATRSFDHPLVIGSIKSNVGHSEPAAGISGLLKAILAIENGTIPGNPTFITPNPKIDFHSLKVRATRTKIPWPKAPFRRASVNSFGYGGSNAHVILEDPKTFVKGTTTSHVSSYMTDEDDLFAEDEISKRPFVLVFSANNESSLQSNCKVMRNHLINPRVKVKLPDLAYTLSERRSHHFNRGYIVTQSTNLDEGSFVYGKKSSEAPKIGFIFTGQGAQWSQMGKDLVETFPAAKSLLKHLDDVLQSTPNPPSWSLLRELVEPRSPELLRLPEFSQPLCTALQLVILAILEDWGVSARSVAGHSSGEIAAAYAAGYLTREDAIKVAFYRGQAAKECKTGSQMPVGMLAVGLGPDQVSEYIKGSEDSVHIACFNSPNSVTLSGTIAGLDDVKSRLVEDHHFARFLQVNLAYHSKFMDAIGDGYEHLLQLDFKPQTSKVGNVTMFSSVLGRQMDQLTGIEYWKMNMVSPVRFDQAVKAMISGPNSADFLIEVGPSGALAGVVTQIKNASAGQGSGIRYQSALSRGQNAIKSMFDVAGRLFIADGAVNLAKVNKDESETGVKSSLTITDLPNYSWDYSTQYWYENESSKDWRYRMFPHHDLLGSKILGTSWHAPTFKKSLRVEDLLWLKHHKMGPEIVFPAAGFMAMAVEAISQSSQALRRLEEKTEIRKPRFRIRNVTFARALVLEENHDGHKIMLTLTPLPGAKDSWHEFRVSSLTGEIWNEHSRGLVRVEEDVGSVAPQNVLTPLAHATPGRLWYKSMHDAGYNFGPLFQKHLEVESVSGQRNSRSIVSLTEPASEYPQSTYPMNPVCIDGCLQSCAPSLWAGNKSGISDVLVPAIIDEVIICSSITRPDKAISITSSKYVGLGRREETKNYMSDASVYDQSTGLLLFQVLGLRYHKLDTREDPYAAHTYSRVVWRPDITYLSQSGLLNMTSKNSGSKLASEKHCSYSGISEVIDLIAHKKPNVKVTEVNMIPADSTSVWLDGSSLDKPIRAPSREVHIAFVDATALIRAQETYGAHDNTTYDIVDLTRPTEEFQAGDTDSDLVIVRISTLSAAVLPNVVQNAGSMLSDGGYILLLEHDWSCVDSGFEDAVIVNNKAHFDSDKSYVRTVLAANGFRKTRHIPCDQSETLRSAYLSVAKPKDSDSSLTRSIELVHLNDPTEATSALKRRLEGLGWRVSEQIMPFNIQSKKIILIADELSCPILPTIDMDQWEALKGLTTSGNRILWVTVGSQLNVTNPNNAMIYGLARTIRNEDPSISFTILDVETSSGPETLTAIDMVLKSLDRPAPKTYIENEFVERRGTIHVSRIRADDPINQAEKADAHGAEIVVASLHDFETTVRLRCERLGTLDSLHYAEVAATELPLRDNCVEVELAAAGLNFKDVAITMGIVPENQYLLGLEGAGTIRRAGKLAASSYEVGQRVLVFEKGTFGNRIIATTERTHHIPDWMSFEEASTLASVYLTALYSIHDLANTQKGDRVLIHSATGGLGIASINICQHIGAEIFASVGTDEKRAFLIEKFGIPSTHIFNSRTTAFAPELMRLTNGEGVNVILNSLTGDILDESWRCIANGGTMVELGKKDMLDRNSLSMEPFGRNASYRCFDMSHKHVSDALIARLLDQLFDLLQQGHVKPISPIKTFSFEDIASAFHFMRGANHIGKIVISNGVQQEIQVPVRPATRELALAAETSILIIGGLKGLCGSLAIYLARLGARHLVILSRSDYDDKRSQGVLKDIDAEGCQVDLVRGDVSNLEDVRHTFKQSSVPIGGIIQGAMVLRDKIFASMTIEDYHTTIASKVQGTWNLHNVALEENLTLGFFTMLSSISGVVGQKGQANYAAANAFLDSFAVYRQNLGLKACSVDLGAIEDVGYMSEHSDLVVALDSSAWTPINEGLFHKIMRFSLIQQISPINVSSSSQLITSIAVPQQENSKLLVDARFAGLCFGNSSGHEGTGNSDGSQEIQAFFLTLRAGMDSAVVLNAAVDVVNRQFMTTLRLSEPMEPAKPLSSYGLDSLSAVEFRNWVRVELGTELTTLEITNASSLISLCEKIISKIPKLANGT
ncbi:hypothetical protein MMC18_004551 [Xylographa bjoerkii]|nr:hypothetical protein [Xylographa bjoerkii]